MAEFRSLFPNKSSDALTAESIAETFSYIHEQSHLLHLQTLSFTEHKCLDTIYSEIVDIKDDVLERMQGYLGKRIKAYKIRPLSDYSPNSSNLLVAEIISFAKSLEEFASSNNMPDIENIAQSLSGLGAKSKYLLTLS